MKRNLLCAAIFVLLAACGTTDSALHQQGRSDSYVIGFHDGRHSGMREAGNNFEHFVQDRERYDTNEEYREGWLAGEEEGKRMQAQADAVGNAAAAGIAVDSANKSSKHSGMSKEAMEKATRNVDTSELNNLGK
jgi:phage protein D